MMKEIRMTRPANQGITAAEHAAVRTFLLGKGFTAAQCDAAVGAAAAGRTRHQVEQQLTAWLKTRPKGP
jgi:hypothetical protein